MKELCVGAVAFLASGALFSLWEFPQPRQNISYKQAIARDFAALVIRLFAL